MCQNRCSIQMCVTLFVVREQIDQTAFVVWSCPAETAVGSACMGVHRSSQAGHGLGRWHWLKPGLGFFLWEDLGVMVLVLGPLGRFFLNSKFTFKPLPLEAAGRACGQVRAPLCLRRAVGQEPRAALHSHWTLLPCLLPAWTALREFSKRHPPQP